MARAPVVMVARLRHCGAATPPWQVKGTSKHRTAAFGPLAEVRREDGGGSAAREPLIHWRASAHGGSKAGPRSNAPMGAFLRFGWPNGHEKGRGPGVVAGNTAISPRRPPSNLPFFLLNLSSRCPRVALVRWGPMLFVLSLRCAVPACPLCAQRPRFAGVANLVPNVC